MFYSILLCFFGKTVLLSKLATEQWIKALNEVVKGAPPKQTSKGYLNSIFNKRFEYKNF